MITKELYRQCRLGLTVLMLIFSVVAFSSDRVLADKTPNDSSPTTTDALVELKAQALTESDMPSGFSLSESGVLDLEDNLHPLNSHLITNMMSCEQAKGGEATLLKSTSKCSNIYNYMVGYGFSGFDQGDPFTGHYLYKYSSQELAVEVAHTIVESWSHNIAESTSLEPFRTKDESYSHAITFIDKDHLTVNWYVAAKNGTLVLLLTHGLDQETVNRSFASSINQWLLKSSQKALQEPTFFSPTSMKESNVEEMSGWQTAYTVGVVQWTWYPHYGAKFSGHNGRNQYYTGPSGTPPGFSGWTWAPNPGARNQLLIDSSWRTSHYPESHNEDNYHAYLDCPC